MSSENEEKKEKLSELLDSNTKTRNKLNKIGKVLDKVFLLSLISLIIETIIFILTGFGAEISYPNLVEITSIIFLINVDGSLIAKGRINKKIKKLENDFKYELEELKKVSESMNNEKDKINGNIIRPIENENVITNNKTLVKTFKNGGD